MKKLLAIVLSLALVLSFGVSAFAFSSPTRDSSSSSSDDLPATTEAEVVPVAPAPAKAKASIIANGQLTEEEKKVVDEAIAEVVKEGFLPTESFMVEAEGPSTIIVAADEDAVIFVIYPNGTVKQFAVKDLVKTSDGHFELPVDGDCVVVIAKKA